MKLRDFTSGYKCDAKTNNYIHKHFTEMTEADAFLIDHRAFIEKNKLGFGDRAFHYMWLLILQDLFEKKTHPRLLEIGVYKGQVISLWSLIARRLNHPCAIHGVTPLSGNTAPRNKLTFYWNFIRSKSFREDAKAGNFYSELDYLDVIKSVFNHFNLQFQDVTLHRGLSSTPEILSELENITFDLIYIDGDHTREAVEMDIKNYSGKISLGGYLVMDDASCNLPGGENNEYWKGHQGVSDACNMIESLGFKNVLNVGHNRIFQRTK